MKAASFGLGWAGSGLHSSGVKTRLSGRRRDESDEIDDPVLFSSLTIVFLFSYHCTPLSSCSEAD